MELLLIQGGTEEADTTSVRIEPLEPADSFLPPLLDQM